MTRTVLQTRDLTKAYGGLIAVNRVDLTLNRDEPHAIIGPNGAGKSSLINLITGQISPTSGEIRYRDENIAGLPSHKIARLGIGRSFQKTNLFPTLTCFENCWLAAQARLPHAFKFFRSAVARSDLKEAVEQALETVGLTHQARTPCFKLSYGEQRQVEIAMVLATAPDMIALDEPMAGMGKEESERVIQLLLDLRKTLPLLLIEHDIDAVLQIAHTMTVMVNGSVIASGPVAAVRNDPLVQEAYLGDLAGVA